MSWFAWTTTSPWAPVLGSWWIDARLHLAVWPHGLNGAKLPIETIQAPEE